MSSTWSSLAIHTSSSAHFCSLPTGRWISTGFPLIQRPCGRGKGLLTSPWDRKRRGEKKRVGGMQRGGKTMYDYRVKEARPDEKSMSEGGEDMAGGDLGARGQRTGKEPCDRKRMRRVEWRI